jgi:hypothetical protein
MEELFTHPSHPRPYKVPFHQAMSPLDYYRVRLFLLSLDWVEQEDWVLMSGLADGVYELRFRSLEQALYFKLSFRWD